MNNDEIKHFKSLLRQGSLRHMNILLDDKFQKELLTIIKDYEKLQQENKRLYNLNNTIFRELLDKKYENKKQKEVIDKVNVFLNNHDKNAGKLYYKYNNKYLLSEIKEDIRKILKEVE
jgi:hypothetical protein